MHQLIILVVVVLIACGEAAGETAEAEGTTAEDAASSATAGQPASAGAGGVGAGASPAASAGSAASAPVGEGGASGTPASAGTTSTGGAGGATQAGAGAGAGGAAAGSGAAGDGSIVTAPPPCDPALSRANRELVATAIDELFVERDITAVDRHWSDPYHQHNPIAQSGVATFRSLMGSFITSPSFGYERLLTLADCELVVVYGRYAQTGVIFDMFRVQDGKIMEHWDSDANQASSVGQLATLDESAPTEATRALFTALSAALLDDDAAAASELLAASYVEHHGSGASGPDALGAFLAAEDVAYTEVHHVIADGNYVFALSEGTRGGAAFGFYDLFRLEADRFAEHWDSRRAVPGSTASGLGIF